MKKIISSLRKFRKDRGWGKHHTPKNLAMSIAIESAELMEHYQWTDNEGFSISGKTKKETAEEVADIFIYLLNFCDVTGIDLLDATRLKIKKNAVKYPVPVKTY